jgi:hypothetical protein
VCNKIFTSNIFPENPSALMIWKIWQFIAYVFYIHCMHQYMCVCVFVCVFVCLCVHACVCVSSCQLLYNKKVRAVQKYILV